jgi:hypothetical protein
MVHQATLELGQDGAVVRQVSTTREAGTAPDAQPASRTVVSFGADSAIIETTRDGETERQALPSRPVLIPQSFSHFAFEELAIRRALTARLDTVWRPGDPPNPVAVRRPTSDSVALETGGLGTWRARVDDTGRILGMDAGALGRTIERVESIDVDAVADRWAEEDARGAGMGPLSPRDTMSATVRGARITVDYSRPSKRGRVVFGGLVPYDEIWRTGANQATHLTTDRALEVGGTRIPAGTYTLFTIPGQDEWTLIVSRQTGQAGTDYDPEQDLARLPMPVDRLDEPVERFTIAAEQAGQGGDLAFIWDRTRARLPFTVVRTSNR